jgi:alpha-L-fucosidase
MWRNDSRPPVLGTNYIQRYIKLADASGLGTRELTTAPIHLSKADRQQREKIDDIIPYTVVLMDDYNPEAAVFRYTSGDQLLRMKVLQLKGYLRVSAEIIVDGKKQTILYSLTRSDSYELDDIRNGDRTGYNYWQSLCMTAKRNGDIEWFGDAMCGESFKAKLVNPTEAAPKLITMLRKLVLPDH